MKWLILAVSALICGEIAASLLRHGYTPDWNKISELAWIAKRILNTVSVDLLILAVAYFFYKKANR